MSQIISEPLDLLPVCVNSKVYIKCLKGKSLTGVLKVS